MDSMTKSDAQQILDGVIAQAGRYRWQASRQPDTNAGRRFASLLRMWAWDCDATACTIRESMRALPV